jgi:hypothetical protein
MALKRNERYPGRFDNPSAAHPQGAFKNRTSPTAKDGSYLEKDWANDWDGFMSSLLDAAAIVPNGLVDEVGSSQYYSALLSVINATASSKLDTLRINVASAATVDLTTAAPDTRHINITGTTAITQFTVAAGLTYFVRFDAALTLTNNANIVTNRGANITTAAGDTCIIRATAANVVEVLCGSFLSDAAVGTRGQIWQDVTGSRAVGTVYTNTTGRPIMVTVAVSQVGGNVTSVTVGGVIIGTIQNEIAFERSLSTFIVPNGATYSLSAGNALDKWSELR